MTVPPALAGCIAWLRTLRCGAFFIETVYPGKGRRMKNIIKCMIINAKDGEKKIADMLRNDLYVTEQIENEATVGKSDEDIWELTPAEELSMQISFELAFIAADSFSEMVDGMEIELIESIIRRLKFSDYKTAVRMLQAMFLVKGYKDTAHALDILMFCEEHDKEVYECFMDHLFETDVFEWFQADMRLKLVSCRPRLPVCHN